MNLAEIKKLKVAELRAKLQERGLETKGLKADLVERLMSAIEAESHGVVTRETGDEKGPAEEEEEEDGAEQTQDDSMSESVPEVQSAAHMDRQALTGTEEEAAPAAKAEVKQGSSQLSVAPLASVEEPTSTGAPKVGQLQAELPVVSIVRLEKKVLEQTLDKTGSWPAQSQTAARAAELTVAEESAKKAELDSTPVDAVVEEPEPVSEEQFNRSFDSASPARCEEAATPGTRVSAPPPDSAPPPATAENTSSPATTTSQPVEDAKKRGLNGGTEGKCEAEAAGDEAEADWSVVAEKGSGEESGSEPDTGEKRGQDTVAGAAGDGESRGVKRPYSERGRGYYEFKEEINYNRAKSPEPEPEPELANEEEVDGDTIRLDSYNGDLHFEVGPDGTSGQPLLSEKFPLLWSGCRVTHGVNQGKVGFEAKFVKKLPVTELSAEDTDTYVLRVGWSVDNSSFQLGEVELSYCFDGQGRKVSEGKEEDFGESFTENDVIGCYAAFSDCDVELSFHKNGCPLGVAFRVDLANLAGRALYPHVLCRNCSVSLNLESTGAPWYPSPPGYTLLAALPPELRHRAPLPPKSKQECEVLMMVGMPGAGKTHWAKTHMAQNPEKHYNLLGTHTILSTMRGTPGTGQKEQELQQATQCLSQLIRIAARRRRNYILDQANIYSSAQRHKMLLFAGFQRRAVVVCPGDKEWQRRLELHQQEEGEEVPQMSILKVKVSFSLPEVGDHLDEVLFPEMSRSETEKLLAEYKEEARRLLPTPPKRRKRTRRNKPLPSPPAHPGRNHRDWGPGWNRGGYPPQPYGHPPYWGPQHREDVRPFHNRYRTDFDRFYGRDYDPQRYREYYRQYTGEWNSYHHAQGHYGNRSYGHGGHRGYW
ncbi:heterogeneous nuclear ribonucleoprotein U-like protein 2 [Scleropages formosus]|uniref:Si:ch211-107m4.1 n=1 Tax=Scleropages formosus TaxID=113540 RepID=A0A8C9W145_SCLFO|nr:heterogeneous nuclear ribonucleoprotein U-like protein 2 [Scleropages formosus]